MRPRIYVAGPISKGDLRANVVQAHGAGIALLKAGFAPMVPHGSCFWGNLRLSLAAGMAFVPEASHSGIGHAEWLDVDLAWVAVCDGVLRLPGESVGADLEVAFAREQGIPVFTSIDDLIANWRPEAAHAAADFDGDEIEG